MINIPDIPDSPHESRFLDRLAAYFTWVGLALLVVGIGRLGVELAGGDLAETFYPQLFSTPTLFLGMLYAAVGYLFIYTMAAIGAQEPPALSAIQASLIGGIVAAIITLIWGLTSGIPYALIGLLWTVATGALAYWAWGELARQQVWRIFGEKIVRQRQASPLIYLSLGLGIVILGAIGLIYAILTGQIEVPLDDPLAGDLLYTTTFDAYNDEWDLPKGRQAANIVDGELVLTESSGFLDSVFYARLDSRQFRNFDLHVQTRQAEGDNDNSYGVIFRWRDVDNFYRFEISGDGYYRLSKTKAGVTENITQWIPSDLIHAGQASNQISIVAKEDTFTFYINGQRVQICGKGQSREALVNPLTGECISDTWQDQYVDEDFPQGKLALTIGTTATTDITQAVVIGFDNVLVVGP